ncbi:MAG: hypothetical protein R3B53_03900 [Candidatus Paceibacterota bacterium]
MKSLRTVETEAEYQKVKSTRNSSDGCYLCEEMETVVEFKYWRIILNDFPYDTLAKVHHMIIPKEHIKESELTPEAKDELVELKSSYLDENYEYLLEALTSKKSIPAHHHLHLIVTHDHYSYT